MLWIALAAGVLLWVLASKRSTSGEARLGWLAAFGAAALLVVTLRLGPQALLAAGPMLASLAWALVRQLRKSRDAGSFVGAPQPSARGMSREEALRVLGLKEGASLEEVAAAHRQLIKKLHPDQGGSSFLAQQVNEARKVLESDS